MGGRDVTFILIMMVHEELKGLQPFKCIVTDFLFFYFYFFVKSL